MCYKGAMETTMDEYARKNPQDMAESSGSQFNVADNCLIVPYCRNDLLVSHPEGDIIGAKDNSVEINQAERIVILQYLCWSKGLPPRGRWLSFLELPGGEHHYAPFQNEVVFPIAKTYGKDIDAFKKLSWGMEEVNISGDAGFIIPVLPCLQIAVIIWKGDEDFSPRANILFDSASPHHLPTASLYVLGIEAVCRVYPYKRNN